MGTHSGRNHYDVVDEGLLAEPADVFGSCPHAAAAGQANGTKPTAPKFKFVRQFGRPQRLPDAQRQQMISELVRLGQLMNQDIPGDVQPDTDIPAGYTYLGQFIAHEITFDRTKGIPDLQPVPDNWRSPQIDLDSLYGSGGPSNPANAGWYDDERVLLKLGETDSNGRLNRTLWNDLHRDATGAAALSDERNDENLPLAQTHVALVKFHNQWVENLRGQTSPGTLFDEARLQVCRHVQWIILHDYLPRIVDRFVLQRVREECLRHFDMDRTGKLEMPLEFSAAAFRFGHSMVRKCYEWNYYHSSKPGIGGPPNLSQLFGRTKFSGTLGPRFKLESEWVIDWRHFYDFEGLPYERKIVNLARPLNTIFDLHLDKITGYPHNDLPDAKKSITVRNLLRGFALELASGETVAEAIDPFLARITPAQRLLTPEEIASEPHREILGGPLFRKSTPLWFYILKEAEVLQEGRKLGPVGSYIVATTLIKMIMNTPDSIFHDRTWRPKSERLTASNEVLFEMPDLLHFADVVNPIGF